MQCGVVQCGIVQCGLVQCGVVQCGVVCLHSGRYFSFKVNWKAKMTTL